MLLKPILRCLNNGVYRCEWIESVLKVPMHVDLILLLSKESLSPKLRCCKRIIDGRSSGQPNRSSKSVVCCSNRGTESTERPSSDC